MEYLIDDFLGDKSARMKYTVSIKVMLQKRLLQLDQKSNHELDQQEITKLLEAIAYVDGFITRLIMLDLRAVSMLDVFDQMLEAYQPMIDAIQECDAFEKRHVTG